VVDNLWLALIGVVAGLAGGMLGIGGSIIMIPGMNLLFGPHQHVHQATAMIVNFFVVVPAAFQHARARAIVWPVVRGIAPGAVVAVLIGVAASEASIFAGRNQVYLTGLFGLFMAYVGLADLLRLFSRRQAADTPDPAAVPAWKAILLVGIPAGFIAGLLGVGGGIMMVPLQRRVLRIPLRMAIANSATTIIVLSLIGSGMKNYAVVSGGLAPWWKPVSMAAVLIPTAMCAAFIGGKLTHTLPVKHVRIAFIGVLFVFAARMCLRAAAAL
jgi:uncharacterized membrane protein YfcA